MNPTSPRLLRDAVAALGLTLPPASAPVATYVSTVRAGSLLYVSGQIPMADGQPAYLGRVGEAVSLPEGLRAAQAAALGVLAQVAAVTDGTVAAVRRVVRLGVFVASPPEFTGHPQVANGASDLMVGVFGEAGRHTRAAVGVSSLPRGVAVEVDAVIELEAGQ